MLKLNQETIMGMVRGFQPACVIIAAAELDLFTLLQRRPMSAASLAKRTNGDLRALVILLDVLTAMGFLKRSGDRDPIYSVPTAAAAVLAEGGSGCMLGMVRHLGNCLRRWSELAHVVQCGKPARRRASIRGASEDLTAFIRAMHEISAPMADPLVGTLGKVNFTHLLDLGGASGTWTIAFLKRNPSARATIMDQPDVIPLAKQRMRRAGLSKRVQFCAGDFMRGALPRGADLAWVSAIVHQNSRTQNRRLFAKVFKALVPGGRIMIRDIVMNPSRTSPEAGAFFAVNMLVNTPGGGTFTFAELADDLASAGFTHIRLLRRGQAMDSIVSAGKAVAPPRNAGS